MAKGNGGGNAEGITVGRISIKVSPDTKRFRSELKQELEDIEHTLKGDVEVKAHLESAQLRADFNRLMAQLKAAGAKGIAINTHMAHNANNNGGNNGGNNNNNNGGGGKNRKNKLPNLPDVPDVPKLDFPFPSFGSGINPAGWVVILGAIAAAAGPVVGLISTALVAIPGLIALIGTPIAAITLGLDGFKKAAEKIKQPFEDLKTKMSEVAESSFSPVLQRVADEIFPKLKASLPSVTQGLAKMADSVISGLSGPRMQASIERIGAAFSNMDMSGFTSGFTGLIDQFTQKLPGITQWINEAGAGFDAWVQKVSADGSLQTAFSNLGTVVKEIASTITDLGRRGIEFMSNPENIQMTLDLLHGIETTLNAIMTASEAIASAWNDMFHRGIEPDPSTATKGRNRVLPAGKDFDKNESATRIDNVTKKLQEAGVAADTTDAKINSMLMGAGSDAGTGPTAFNSGKTGVPVPGATPEAPNKITPPETEEAKAKLEEYNTFVQKVTGDVQTAMQNAAGTQGGTVPPPNFDAFKAAWNELPNVVNQATQATINAAQQLVNGAVIALQGGGNQIVAAVQQWQNGILTALSTMYAIGLNAGTQLATGMANGISAGTPFITAAATRAAMAAKQAAEAALGIQSPSKVFKKIGEQTAEGMGIGLENGFKPVLDQAADLSKKISDAFTNGGDPTGYLEGFTKSEASRMEKVLSYQSKLLGYQAEEYDAAGRTGEAEAARAEQKKLGRQKASLDLAQDFAELQNPDEGDWKGPIAKIMNGMAHMPMDFINATADQAMQDLGISGGGVMGAVMDYGQQLGDNIVFNVGNMEDALTASQRIASKKAIGVIGR